MQFKPRNPIEPIFEEFIQPFEKSDGTPNSVLLSFVLNLFAEMRRETARAAFTQPVGKAMKAALEKHVEPYCVAVGLPQDCPIVIDRILDRIVSRNLPVTVCETANVVIEVQIKAIPEINDNDEFIGIVCNYDEAMPAHVNNRIFIDIIRQLYRKLRREPFVILERELLLLDRCYRFLESLTVNTGTKVGA